jgi:hypothetical protein
MVPLFALVDGIMVGHLFCTLARDDLEGSDYPVDLSQPFLHSLPVSLIGAPDDFINLSSATQDLSIKQNGNYR